MLLSMTAPLRIGRHVDEQDEDILVARRCSAHSEPVEARAGIGTAPRHASVTFTAGPVCSHLEARPAIREAVVGPKQVHAALSFLAKVGIPRTLVHIWGTDGAGDCMNMCLPGLPCHSDPGPPYPYRLHP
ncbi:LOW QUALITY PROTEIN: hypothetical protein MC885_006682 [Smutsia gigantea]|nr:LOW QUALITY PROTEIN: hypothetical protein MC885_006682 [Smutsia gigantea]